MQTWLSFRRVVVLGSVLVTNSLLGCGNVDPGDNKPQGGSGGDGASAGSGAVGAEGGEPGGGSGGSSGSAGAPNMQPEGALLPWAVGNSWTYRVNNVGVFTEKTTTIGDEEEVGGEGPHAAVLAYHVTTAKGTDGTDRTDSWQAPDPENPDRILRYREQAFNADTGALELEEHWDPARLHADGTPEHTVLDASWLERYDEYKLPVGGTPSNHLVSERWTVLGDDETVEVPAGVFEHTIHVRKAGSSGVSKEYWYLRGVGKIKETGSQTEELVDYNIEGQTP